MIVDLFAGGGGASRGIELALGRSPDLAINHDPEAVALHAANHPRTRHLVGDVWDVRPREACGGAPVDLLWASPDCTFHSKARGGKPFRDPKSATGRRGLAWVVVRWARDVRPEVICLENVEEFQDWGPLGEDGRPDKLRKGLTFRRFVGQLKALGYNVEHRELRASDYGAPTIRKRLFIICSLRPISWSEPTHGPQRIPYRTAAECIDWSLPCPSIFERAKPLADKTMARIARGIQRFVIDSPSPFIVPTAHAGDLRCHSIDEPLRTVTGAHRGDHAVVAPTLVKNMTNNVGQRPDAPLSTVLTGNHHGVVAPFLARSDMHQSNAACTFDPLDPLRTVTTAGGHAVVAPFVVPATHGDSGGRADTRSHDARDPLRTITTRGAPFHVVAPVLVHSGNGERDGQAPRVYDIERPLSTVMAEGQKHGLVAAFLAKHYGGHEATGSRIEEPVHTVRSSRCSIASVPRRSVSGGRRTAILGTR